MEIEQHPNRDISPRTKKNFYHAKSKQLPFSGKSLYFVNWVTGTFRWVPLYEKDTNVLWWDLSLCSVPVTVTRIYWLCVGFAKVTPQFPIPVVKDLS